MSDLFRKILAPYPATSQPHAPPIPLGNAGGFSGARLWRFASARGPLLLRAWPVEGPDVATLQRNHAWLLEAADLGFLPVPIPTLDGRTVVEVESRLYELTSWMPGQPDLARPPTSEHLQAIFMGLARFHARLGGRATHGPSPGLIARFAELQGLVRVEFSTIQAALERSPFDPRTALARRWLDQARRQAPGLLEQLRQVLGMELRLQPCLRDARPDHFLFEGGRLTGLIDFGAMGVDTVAGDLARLLSETVGADRVERANALQAYERVRPLDDREIVAIARFETVNALLGPGHWVRWHFLEHRVFDDPQAVHNGLVRGLERLEQAPGIATG